MKLYLLVMKGQGDTHVKLVTETIWNWIFGPLVGQPAGKNGWDDPTTPESVQQAIRREEPDDETGRAFITTGSWENDRALHAMGDDVPFDEYGATEQAARLWAAAHRHTIVETWHGYIY